MGQYESGGGSSYYYFNMNTVEDEAIMQRYNITGYSDEESNKDEENTKDSDSV